MKKEMREGKRKRKEQPTKPSATITSSTLDKETTSMEITAGPSTSQAEDPEPTPSPSPIKNPTDATSEEEDDEEYPYRKAFIDDPNPRSNRHRWLVLFYHHLNKPDCGRKKQKNRLQHAEHVRRILEDLQPRGSDIDILSEDEDYIVWTHWVDPNMETLRSGTIRSYLGSYQSFLDFVAMEQVRKGIFPEVEADILRIFRNVFRRLKGWRRVRSDLRVTATNIRKWIVTTCHEKKTRGSKFDEDIIRQGLCHSDKTAKSFYLRPDLTSVAAQAVEIIVMCTSKKPKRLL